MKIEQFRIDCQALIDLAAPLNLTERGALLTLLLAQWQSGPLDPAQIRQLLGASGEEFTLIWRTVGALFEPTAENTVANPQLEDARTRALALRATASQKAMKAAAVSAAVRRARATSSTQATDQAPSSSEPASDSQAWLRQRIRTCIERSLSAENIVKAYSRWGATLDLVQQEASRCAR